MPGDFSTADIIAFLDGEKSKDETEEFWLEVNNDKKLQVEVMAYQLLIDRGREKRFKGFLKLIENFDSTLPSI